MEQNEKRGYAEVLANSLGYSFSWVEDRLTLGDDIDQVIDTLKIKRRLPLLSGMPEPEIPFYQSGN